MAMPQAPLVQYLRIAVWDAYSAHKLILISDAEKHQKALRAMNDFRWPEWHTSGIRDTYFRCLLFWSSLQNREVTTLAAGHVAVLTGEDYGALRQRFLPGSALTRAMDTE